MELYDYIIMKDEERSKFFFDSVTASQNTCITSHSKSQWNVLIRLFTFVFIYLVHTQKRVA